MSSSRAGLGQQKLLNKLIELNLVHLTEKSVTAAYAIGFPKFSSSELPFCRSHPIHRSWLRQWSYRGLQLYAQYSGGDIGDAPIMGARFTIRQSFTILSARFHRRPNRLVGLESHASQLIEWYFTFCDQRQPSEFGFSTLAMHEEYSSWISTDHGVSGTLRFTNICFTRRSSRSHRHRFWHLVRATSTR